MSKALQAGRNHAAGIFLFQAGILAIAAGLQYFWGPLSDDRFGPLSAVNFLMAMLVAVLSVTILLWPHETERSWLLPVAVPLLFALMAIVQLVFNFGLASETEPIDDLADLIPSFAASIMLLAVLRIYGAGVSFRIAAIAFAFHAAASLTDLFDDWLVTNLPIETALTDWLTMVASGLALTGYTCALLIQVARYFSPKREAAKGAISFVRLFNAAEETLLGGWFSAKVNDLHYFFWRLKTGGSSYSDFYAAQIATKLARGKSHKTLGNKQYGSGSTASTEIAHDEGSFASRGAELFELCLKLGLTERDIVVDYGCGSLRIGQHFIKFLQPKCYWGLDVTDSFYRIGLSMLPEEVLREKQPQCQVISEQNLLAAGLAGPSFIVCNAVLKHVPQSEFSLFMDRLLSLAGSGTRLILTFHSAPSLARIKGKSWAYPPDHVRSAITSRISNAHIEYLSKPKKPNRLASLIQKEIWLIET